MKTMTKEEVAEKLRLHQLWLDKDPSGELANFSRANLSEVNLSGAYFSRANLSRANFSRANLYGTDFSGANLYGCNFSRANLSEANFFGSYFSGAFFSGSNFSGANLSRANFSGCNLSGANFCGANLSGANLSRANFSEAIFSRVVGVNYAQCSFDGFGETGRMLTVARINDELVYFCGCFRGSYEQIIKFVDNDDDHLKESRMLGIELVTKAVNFKQKRGKSDE